MLEVKWRGVGGRGGGGGDTGSCKPTCIKIGNRASGLQAMY